MVSSTGYLAVYISTTSIGDVTFDHFANNVYPGVLVQEQHYYPCGLPIREGESGTITPNKETVTYFFHLFPTTNPANQKACHW